MKHTPIFKAAALCMAASVANAQDPEPHLELELNAMATTAEGACQLTFLVLNSHEASLEKLVYETVLFNVDGGVDRLTLFDFGEVPAVRPRVRQFSIPGLACEKLGRILINGANTCSGTDFDTALCADPLKLGSRTAVELIG